jgi:hypothetical protein
LSGTVANAQVKATHLTAALPVAQGGTGSATQNFVDLTTTQTIAGTKTFSSAISGSVTGSAASFTGGLVGDVSGTQGATVVSKLQGTTLAVSGGNAPVSGQVLAFNAGQWAPATVISNGGLAGGSITITGAQVGSLAKASCTSQVLNPADPQFAFTGSTSTMGIVITPQGVLHSGDWDQGGITWVAYVSPANTLKVHVCNGSNGTVAFNGNQTFNIRFIN